MHDSKFAKIVSGVLGIIHNSKKEVLFVKQKSGPFAGSWLLPGGSIDFGEDSVSAVKREVLEETGIKILNPEFKGVYVMLGEWKEGKYHLIMQGFKCQSDGDIPVNFEGDNVDAVLWSKPEHLTLHSTDKLILTECKLANFTEVEIRESLERDKITMETHRV